MAQTRLNGSAGDSMFEEFKETWRKIQQDPPGKRFRQQYQRRQSERKSIVKKFFYIISGIIVVLVGIFMLPAPGPGMLVIFVGLGVISQESLWMSIMMDKLEIRIRKLIKWSHEKWNGSSLFVKILIVSGTLLLALAALYGAFLYFRAHYNWP